MLKLIRAFYIGFALFYGATFLILFILSMNPVNLLWGVLGASFGLAAERLISRMHQKRKRKYQYYS
jgi:thiol:disulfide interchange protein